MQVNFYFQSQCAREDKLSQAISAFADNVRPANEMYGRRTLHVASTSSGCKTFEVVERSEQEDCLIL